MGRGRIVEEQRDQIGARPRDQRVAVAHVHREIDIGHAMQRPLQGEDRAGIDARDLPAEAGSCDHQMNAIGHEWLRSGRIHRPHFSPNRK